ncbi:MAG: Crp/Fnr family transcriptional regulator [Pseudohongiellaceae bacterium]
MIFDNFLGASVSSRSAITYDLGHMSFSFQQLIDHLPTEAQSEYSLAKGEFLFRQQQPTVAIFAVVSGRVRLFRDLPDGSSVTLHVARSGETFAEAALFTQHYHCHAQTELVSKVLRLNSAALLETITAHKDLGLYLSQILAGQVRDMRAMLSLRDIRSADERLMAWLRLQVRDELMEVVIDRPWTGISEELGLTKEAVYRSLTRLQHEGFIERAGRQSRERSEVIRLKYSRGTHRARTEEK